jgi:VanZ family protein
MMHRRRSGLFPPPVLRASLDLLRFAVVMAVLPHPPQLPIDRLGDKFEHMLAFSVLTLLAALGWPAFPKRRIAERLSFLGALIELAQSIPELHRDCDIRDWIADTLAILVVLGSWRRSAARGHRLTVSLARPLH